MYTCLSKYQMLGKSVKINVSKRRNKLSNVSNVGKRTSRNFPIMFPNIEDIHHLLTNAFQNCAENVMKVRQNFRFGTLQKSVNLVDLKRIHYQYARMSIYLHKSASIQPRRRVFQSSQHLLVARFRTTNVIEKILICRRENSTTPIQVEVSFFVRRPSYPSNPNFPLTV